MVKELEHLLKRERLRELRLSSLEKRRLRRLSKKSQTHTEVQEIPFKLFYCVVKMEEVAQKGCGVKNISGHNLGSSTITDSVLSRGFNRIES